MKSLDAFARLLSKIITDGGARYRHLGPGKVVERMSDEDRKALSQLTSDQINTNLRVEDYWMTGTDYEIKCQALKFEKELGIQPPPRKKYEE
jgi:hypothetical protein